MDTAIPTTNSNKQKLIAKYNSVRARTVTICAPLKAEDTVVQPVVFVSPPKWHLAHTTWFFETFILIENKEDYTEFDADYSFLFNSYYETVGERVLRPNRGNLSRPTLAEILEYRAYVDEQLIEFMEQIDASSPLFGILEMGLQHEQQHQELLFYDIKYILGHNPIFPVYHEGMIDAPANPFEQKNIQIPEGVYEIGHQNNGFCFDNELGVHKIYLHEFKTTNQLATNKEYLEFIDAGGYTNFNHWLAEGWDWVTANDIKAPLYWHQSKNKWKHYELSGWKDIDWDAPVKHISYYEANAYAAWKGKRLLTEFEWEAASEHFPENQLWQWTASAYQPYPKYKKAEGAIGEYNGKFMVNQMVMRGGSVATPENHIRNTYRNFFHPDLRWMFSGIRLAESIN
jgi:ergothioneine biosynthesis protein EgtB